MNYFYQLIELVLIRLCGLQPRQNLGCGGAKFLNLLFRCQWKSCMGALVNYYLLKRSAPAFGLAPDHDHFLMVFAHAIIYLAICLASPSESYLPSPSKKYCCANLAEAHG
jgi:hypothetical protein